MAEIQKKNKYLPYAVGAGVLLVIYLLTKNNADTGTGQDPTQGNNIPDFDAEAVAMDLLDTMATTGTDEQEILNILKFVTPAQFKLVKTAFGKRQYNATLGNQQNPLAWFTELPFVDLKGWLKSELSATDYAVLKAKYPTSL